MLDYCTSIIFTNKEIPRISEGFILDATVFYCSSFHCLLSEYDLKNVIGVREQFEVW